MFENGILDFLGRDGEPTSDDHVLLLIEETDEPVVLDPEEVARVEVSLVIEGVVGEV